MTRDEAAAVSEAFLEQEAIDSMIEHFFEAEPEEFERDYDPIDKLAEAIAGEINEAVYGAGVSQSVDDFEAIAAIIREAATECVAKLRANVDARKAAVDAAIAEAPSVSVVP